MSGTLAVGMIAVVIPLALLPLGSGGYWARPALEEDGAQQDDQTPGSRVPLLVSPFFNRLCISGAC